MAKILVVFLLFSSLSFAQTAIVSDLDETLKISHLNRPLRALYTALFSQKIYAGMDVFLEQAQTYAPDLYVLTASPKIFRRNIEKLIRHHDLDVKELLTRRGLEDKYMYKFSSVERVLKENSYEDLILIGDDRELDAKVYSDFERHYPNRVKAIYIHVVVKRDLPKNTLPYFTAFDLAIRENNARRMSAEQARIIGISLMQAPMGRIFPKYAYCPERGFDELGIKVSEELRDLYEDLNLRIKTFCGKRVFRTE